MGIRPIGINFVTLRSKQDRTEFGIWDNSMSWETSKFSLDRPSNFRTEGKMKGRSTRGRKRVQLLDDLADGKDYASLKREAEDRSVWKIRQWRW